MRFTSSITWALALIVSAATAVASGDTRLADALQSRNVASARALIAKRVDVNAAQFDGATALHWATYWDNVEAVELLLRAGANPNSANDYGVTPLVLAATNANAAIVERLIKAGATPDLALPTGESPLMIAARTGSTEVVKPLVAAGASVNAKEKSRGQTALMWAVAERHAQVVRALLDRGSEVNARSTSGFTPLMFAARIGDLELVRLLADKGANVNDAAADGSTALHVATVRGYADVAMFLLDHGANPNAHAPGYVALHWASGKWESSVTHDYPLMPLMPNEWAGLGGVPHRKIELIRALLARGANPNARITKKPPRFGDSLSRANLVGATPFMVAAMSGDVEVMRILLAAGADPQLKTQDNQTALMLAAGLGRAGGETLITEKEFLEAVNLCVESGIDVNAVDNAGNTALHATAFLGADTVAQFLVEHRADVNAKNENGETPTKAAEQTVVSGVVQSHPTTAALLRKFGGRTD